MEEQTEKVSCEWCQSYADIFFRDSPPNKLTQIKDITFQNETNIIKTLVSWIDNGKTIYNFRKEYVPPTNIRNPTSPINTPKTVMRIYNNDGNLRCNEWGAQSYVLVDNAKNDPNTDHETIQKYIRSHQNAGKPKPVKTDRFVTLPNGRVYRLYRSARNWWVLRRGEGFVRVRPVRS